MLRRSFAFFLEVADSDDGTVRRPLLCAGDPLGEVCFLSCDALRSPTSISRWRAYFLNARATGSSLLVPALALATNVSSLCSASPARAGMMPRSLSFIVPSGAPATPLACPLPPTSEGAGGFMGLADRSRIPVRAGGSRPTPALRTHAARSSSSRSRRRAPGFGRTLRVGCCSLWVSMSPCFF